MTTQTQITETEEELRIAFADTLGKGASRSAIFVTYHDGDGLPNIELGFPYDIIEGVLEMGPYMKNRHTSPPRDYDERKKQIPIKGIIRFKRIELSDLF